MQTPQAKALIAESTISGAQGIGTDFEFAQMNLHLMY